MEMATAAERHHLPGNADRWECADLSGRLGKHILDGPDETQVFSLRYLFLTACEGNASPLIPPSCYYLILNVC